MNYIKFDICTIAGVIGAFIANIFGGWSSALTTLIIFMAIHYFTGLAVAAFFKNSTKSENGGLSSAVGLKGLVKKIAMLAVVVIAYRLDVLINNAGITRDGLFMRMSSENWESVINTNLNSLSQNRINKRTNETNYSS